MFVSLTAPLLILRAPDPGACEIGSHGHSPGPCLDEGVPERCEYVGHMLQSMSMNVCTCFLVFCRGSWQ